MKYLHLTWASLSRMRQGCTRNDLRCGTVTAIRTILPMLLVWASSAKAFVDPPVITPENPTTETPITVSIRYGVCDALIDYTIETVGTAVELRITKIPTQSDPFCNVPVTTSTFELPLLSAGQHPLTIYFQDIDPPGLPPVIWFQTTLTVTSGAIQPVPSISGWLPLLLLVSGVLIIATWRFVGVKSIPKCK